MRVVREVPLQELYAEPSRNGLTRPRAVRGSGAPMVNMGELFAFPRIGAIAMERVPVTDDEILRSRVLPGDLLFARQSLVKEGAGKCSIVMEVSEPTVFESHLIRVRLNPLIAHPLYFFYFFKSPQGYERIQSIVTQVAAAGIRGSELGRLLVPVPPLREQRRIASILGAYDDLIEVNRRRIAVLEEMARRLFEEWFVHFRFPGHESSSRRRPAALPTDWQQKTFGVLVDETRDTLDPALIDTTTAYVGLEHIPRRSTTLDAWGAAEDVTSIKLRFRRGDILFGKIRPYFHKVVWAPFDGICSSDAIVWRPRSSEVAGLALAVASSDAFVAHSVQTSNGTKMPRANPSVLSRYPVALPPPTLLRQFDRTVMPGVELAALLQAANQRLAASRDLLLPRLISGDLPVPAAERELEAVA